MFYKEKTFVIQYQMVSPENIHTMSVIQMEQIVVIYLEVHIQQQQQQLNKEDMDSKSSRRVI